jgi:hypothetical protein
MTTQLTQHPTLTPDEMKWLQYLSTKPNQLTAEEYQYFEFLTNKMRVPVLPNIATKNPNKKGSVGQKQPKTAKDKEGDKAERLLFTMFFILAVVAAFYLFAIGNATK